MSVLISVGNCTLVESDGEWRRWIPVVTVAPSGQSWECVAGMSWDNELQTYLQSNCVVYASNPWLGAKGLMDSEWMPRLSSRPDPEINPFHDGGFWLLTDTLVREIELLAIEWAALHPDVVAGVIEALQRFLRWVAHWSRWAVDTCERPAINVSW